MRRTAVFKHDLFLRHDPGPNHPESPGRLRDIYRMLDSPPLAGRFLLPEFKPVSKKKLHYNHSERHIVTVAETSGDVFSILDQDTVTSEASYDAARLAAGALVTGIDLLLKGDIDNGFGLVRPPGHHAEKHRSQGFCLFNNVAIACHHAILEHDLERIMVVDWDVHHGNGTQNSFYDSSRVLYVSPHQSPLYPGTGAGEETGRDEGEGYTLNIPLPRGCGDREYADLFREIIIPVGREYRPQLIMISAGFDIHYADPIGSMEVGWQGIALMTRWLQKLADEVCDGRLLVTLEGGYNLLGQKEGIFSVLAELYGGDLDLDFPVYLDETTEKELTSPGGAVHPAIEQVRAVAKKYWKM